MAKNTFSMDGAALAKMKPEARDALIEASPEAAAVWEDSARARRISDVLAAINASVAAATKSGKLADGDVGYIGVNVDREPPFYLKSRQTGDDDRLVVNDGDLKRDGVTGFTDGKKTVPAKTGDLLDAVNVDHYRGKRYQKSDKRADGVRKCDGKCASTKPEKPHAHGDQSSRRVNEADAQAKLDKWTVTFADSKRKPEPVNDYFASIRHAPASRS